ncbi:hypothetical protein SDC9_176995 [bioreactor metagenome]|uniref:Uncharacterized protein n=1 Tax=bioreactor metagenome TaxID=1076179 RepID=A0A645GU81_9ZZZZ
MVHHKVLSEVLTEAVNEGYSITGLIRSPLLGPKGNTEFLVNLRLPYAETKPVEEWIEPLFAENTSLPSDIPLAD